MFKTEWRPIDIQTIEETIIEDSRNPFLVPFAEIPLTVNERKSDCGDQQSEQGQSVFDGLTP